MKHEVTVPAHILQSLLGNAFLMSIGHDDGIVTEQINALQKCLTEQVGNMDTVYGRPPKPTTDGIEFDILAFDDPKVVSLFTRKIA